MFHHLLPIVLNVYTRVTSSNNPASLTARLGATIDVEQNHVRFLGDLVLNLWDCGGQDAFMDSYLSAQRNTVFQHVGVLIYVFDVESRAAMKDLSYYHECMENLEQFSPDAAVFLLLHKMDLVRGPKGPAFDKKKKELEEASGDKPITVFGTSIYDESLYRVRPPSTVVSFVAQCVLHLTLKIPASLLSRLGHTLRIHSYPMSLSSPINWPSSRKLATPQKLSCLSEPRSSSLQLRILRDLLITNTMNKNMSLMTRTSLTLYDMSARPNLSKPSNTHARASVGNFIP